MAFTDRIREVAGRALFGANAPLLESLSTVDLASLVLAVDELGWQRLGGPQVDNNRDFTDVDRVKMVQRSRLYFYRDPLARQAIRLYTAYALGQDLEIRHDNQQAQTVLDTFLSDRGNRDVVGMLGLRRQSNNLLVDGEMVWAYLDDARRPRVRAIDPLEITEIITNPEDSADVWYYRRSKGQRPDPNTDTFYRAWDAEWDGRTEREAIRMLPSRIQDQLAGRVQDGWTIIHSRINNLGQRGYPLLTAGLDWAKALRNFNEDRATITHAAAQFTFKKKVKAGPATVNALAAGLRNGSPVPGMAQTPGYDRRGPVAGATLVENDGIDTEQMRFDTGAANATQDARLLKLQFFAAVGLSEHYFGDPATGNLATATSMERPVELTLAEYQLVLVQALEDLCGLVLRSAGKPTDGLHVLMPPILNVDRPAMINSFVSLLSNVPIFDNEHLWRELLQLAQVDDIDAALQLMVQTHAANQAQTAALQAAAANAGPQSDQAPPAATAQPTDQATNE
jgi:hypothetical protein